MLVRHLSADPLMSLNWGPMDLELPDPATGSREVRQCSQRGGTTRRRGKSCFPRSTLVFREDSKPSSYRRAAPSLLSVLAAASLFFPFSFFPFFPFILTFHLLSLHLASPSHRRYPVGAALHPVGANSTPQLQRQPTA